MSEESQVPEKIRFFLISIQADFVSLFEDIICNVKICRKVRDNFLPDDSPDIYILTLKIVDVYRLFIFMRHNLIFDI